MRRLEEKYPEIIASIMRETKEHYQAITHSAGVNLKVLFTIEDQETRRSHVLPYKYLGRTANYENYLLRKSELKSKFLLHHSLVRRILNECVTGLPDTLCNIR